MDYDQIFSSDLKLFSDEQNTAKTIVLGHFAEAMATPQEPQPMAQRKIRDTRSDPEGKEQDIGPILIDLIQYVNSVRWTILNSSNWQLGTSPGPAEDALPIKSRIPHLKTLEDYKAVLRELKETARQKPFRDFLTTLYEVARDVEVMSNVVGKAKIDLGEKAPAVQNLKQGYLSTMPQMKKLYKLIRYTVLGRGFSTSDARSVDMEIAIWWAFSNGPPDVTISDRVVEQAKLKPQARLAVAEFTYRQNNLHLAETLYSDPLLRYHPTTLSLQRQGEAFLRRGDGRKAASLFSFVCLMPNLRCITFDYGEVHNRLIPIAQRQDYSIYVYNRKYILSRHSDVNGRVFVLRNRVVRLVEPRAPKWLFLRVRMFALNFRRGTVLSATKEQRRPNRVSVLLLQLVMSVAKAWRASVTPVSRLLGLERSLAYSGELMHFILVPLIRIGYSLSRLLAPLTSYLSGTMRLASGRLVDRVVAPILIWLISGKVVRDEEFSETLVEVAEMLPGYLKFSEND